MLIKILKSLFVIPLVLAVMVIVFINAKLQYEPEMIIEAGDTIQYEIVKELRGLKRALGQNADVEMQNAYPEGYVFTNAIYALAWTSFLRHQQHHSYFAEGHAEIQKAWDRIASETGKSSFSESLTLPHGAFYNGWSSFVLGSKLRLEPVSMRCEQDVYHFKQQCDMIANAIQRETYPESYHGAAWPADIMLCVASLSIHDQLFGPLYTNIINDWARELKRGPDSRGMIPHAVDPRNGKTVADARGSSMALMLIFLRDIDSQFAREQFVLFKRNFVDSKLGLTGIREYPKGQSGRGDIDSGPVILDFGGAATIVGMQTLSLFGDGDLSIKIRNELEAFGAPVQREGHKRYLLGTLPMADAFIAWSHSGMHTREKTVSFKRFHVFSTFIVLLLCTCLWFVVRRNRNN